MKILILSQYFKPETFIINDISSEMESLGHEITVLTGKPNYPDGKIFSGYKADGVQTEMHGKNIEIIRIPMIPRGPGRALNLISNYLSFVFSALFFAPWLLRKKQFDLIFVFGVSPITQAIPAILLKFLKQAKCVLWVQDLWPESLIVTGFVKNKFILKCVQIMVKIIYYFCDLILVQSKSFYEPILKISPNAKLAYFPNTFKVQNLNSENLKLPPNFNQILNENFCAVFAGNIGSAQSVETIIQAAVQLQDLINFKIIFVGSGSRLDWIKQQKQILNLNNIECVGRFDSAFMPLIFEKSKIMLLTLNADEILKYTLPWKTQSYMAAGRPIIGAIDGEGHRVITEADCGFIGPAEDSIQLAANLKMAFEMDASKLTQLGKNGLMYFQQNFEMKAQTQKLFNDYINPMQNR